MLQGVSTSPRMYYKTKIKAQDPIYGKKTIIHRLGNQDELSHRQFKFFSVQEILLAMPLWKESPNLNIKPLFMCIK